MLPAREPHAAAPALPPSAQAVIVEVPPRAQREQELQAAAQVRWLLEWQVVRLVHLSWLGGSLRAASFLC